MDETTPICLSYTMSQLYMAPVTHTDRYRDSIDFWRNVYGIDMSAVIPLAKQCAFEEPSVETITGENVLTWPFVVGKLKALCESFFKLKGINLRLFVQEEGSPLPLLLDDDMASLMDLGVGTEATILVDEESF